jgi:hypothetical protein
MSAIRRPKLPDPRQPSCQPAWVRTRCLHVGALALLTAPGLTAGCSTDNIPTAVADASVEASARDITVEHTIPRSSFVFDFDNPCNDEPLHLPGELVDELTVVRPAGEDFLHFELEELFTASGVGSVTGAHYNVRDQFHDNGNAPNLEQIPATGSQRETLHVTAEPPGEGFFIHVLVHGVRLPSGEAKLTQDVLDIECRS